MSAAEKIERKIPSVMPARMSLGQSQRAIYHLTVDMETTREDLVNPEFWKHVAPQLRPTFRIEVINDDYTFFSEYLVIDSGKNWAVVEELRFIDLKTHGKISQSNQSSLYKIVNRGPHLKWCVIRLSDNEVIKDKMGKQEAETFLSNYVRVTPNDNTPSIVQ